MSSGNGLNKKDQPPITLSQEITDPDFDNILNSIITTEEINKSIKNLKLSKSPGIDGTGTDFFKNTSHIIVQTLCGIFNSIMNSAEFPKSWSESIIVPVHKSGSINNPSNFRGISMLNMMYKIFSYIIFDRITRLVEEFDILDRSHNGFCRESTPVDNMFILQAMAQKYILKPGRRFYELYVDSEKAFDSIPHHKMFNCLHNVGFKGKFFKVLVSMYSNTSSRIHIVNSKLTKALTCNVGS